jgi:hypothetical protein
MNRLFAVVENNKVVNVVVEPNADELAANPNKYVEYTNGWDHDNGIDGGNFFLKPTEEISD